MTIKKEDDRDMQATKKCRKRQVQFKKIDFKGVFWTTEQKIVNFFGYKRQKKST